MVEGPEVASNLKGWRRGGRPQRSFAQALGLLRVGCGMQWPVDVAVVALDGDAGVGG